MKPTRCCHFSRLLPHKQGGISFLWRQQTGREINMLPPFLSVYPPSLRGVVFPSRSINKRGWCETHTPPLFPFVCPPDQGGYFLPTALTNEGPNETDAPLFLVVYPQWGAYVFVFTFLYIH